jgi:hypothetical protein
VALKQKLTLLEKQNDDYLHEFYLRFIAPLEDNPDCWQNLYVDDYLSSLSLIAALEGGRDAGSISEEACEELKQDVTAITLFKICSREYLKNVIESFRPGEDPILALEEKLNISLEALVDLFAHLFNLFPSNILPLYWSVESNVGLVFNIDLRFTNSSIMKAMDRQFEHFLSAEKQKTPDSRGLRPQLADGQVLEVIRNPGKGPYGPDPVSSMLIVSIDFNAGKTKIRKALDELLKKLSIYKTHLLSWWYSLECSSERIPRSLLRG